MSIDYPVVMDDWYDDATEGDLTGNDVVAGRITIADKGHHDAAWEYYKASIATPNNGSSLTKGDARALMQAYRDDPTIEVAPT